MKRTLVTLTALSLIAIASPMFAASPATAPLAVSASVATNCTITTAPIAFGVYDTITGTALAGTGTVSVACTKGATGLTIDLNVGSNGGTVVGTSRAMKSGSNYLGYELYTDNPNVTVWTSLSISAAPSKDVRPFTVYGLISANQDVPAGAYTDTVTAAINY